MRTFELGGRSIDDATNPYVIAEIGHNHGGRLDVAEKLVRAAAAAGADAVKLQKRSNRDLFTQSMYDEPYDSSNSYGSTYGAHREALEFGHAEYHHLAEVASDCGVDLMSTAFDMPSVDFLVSLGVPAIKIASADITNTPLLAYAADTKLPLVVSSGGATMDEVRAAHDLVRSYGGELALLQCTTVYPAAPADLSLSVIGTYRDAFPDTVIGFSGHDLGPQMSLVAFALGARVIEKHFTLDHAAKGSDHCFSLEPDEFATMTTWLGDATAALGSATKTVAVNEQAAIRKMGKKIVAARDLPAGRILTTSDLAFKSPGDGLKPYLADAVVGSRLRVPLRADDTLEMTHIDTARSSEPSMRTAP